MKHLIFILPLFLVSCFAQETYMKHVSCRVKEVKAVERYAGLIPEKYYLIKTDCGYRVVSKHIICVGDTICVQINTYTKN